MTTVNSRRAKPQDDFRRKVKIALLDKNMSVASLARSIGRPRPTVSIAINHSRFAGVRELITQELGL